MTFLAFNAGLGTFFVVQLVALIVSANVRRFWLALLRAGLFFGLIALPWLLVWLQPERLDPIMSARRLNLNWVLSILAPAAASLALLWLAGRLNLTPRWLPDRRDDTSPIPAVALLPLGAALAAVLVVLVLQSAYAWLFNEYQLAYLPLVGPLLPWP